MSKELFCDASILVLVNQLFPFNGCWRFRTDIIDHSVDASHTIDYAVANVG
jgi:hypothetical protein